MKKLGTHLQSNFIAALTFAFVLNTGFYTYEVAGRADARRDASHVQSADTSQDLDVVILQMENSFKFKVGPENYTGRNVYLNIADKNKKIIHLEKVATKKYNLKFDLSSLEDGMFIIELKGAGHRYTKEVVLQTKVACFAITWETPHTQIAQNRERNQKNV